MKPSKKMTESSLDTDLDKMLEEIEEGIDYTIDNISLDFPEQSQYDTPESSQLFSSDRKRTLYIYKINNLVKNSKKPVLNYSQNSIKIGFIDVENLIQIESYEVSDFTFSLQIQQNTTTQDNTTSYVMIDEKDIVINKTTKKEKEFLETLDLKLVSIDNPITEKNKNKCFIIESYNRPWSPDGINVFKSTHLIKVTDFKWKNQNSINLVLQKPLEENTVFKGIKIKHPKSTLFGNIKCWGNILNSYSYPKSTIKNAMLIPLFSMPIETQPSLRVLQYWFGKSFLQWSIVKDYIQPNNILSLLNINDNEPNPRKQTFKNARVSFAKVGWIDRNYNAVSPPPNPNRDNMTSIEISDDLVDRKYIYSEGDGIGKIDYDGWISTAPDGAVGDIILEFTEAPIQGKLEKVLRDFLTYRYNYDRKFLGAKYDQDGNPANKSAELRQKFEGQKPEDVIDGLFEEWKFNNPTYLNDQAVSIFKQLVYMLSTYTYSKFCINKGYNDDVKILSPYYFELVSKPAKLEEGYWEFTDCIVQLKSLYFNFIDADNIKMFNNNIDSNKIYKLESNFFNWLSLVNNLEANDIPSLIPGDMTLSAGEYGKYLVNLIVNNTDMISVLNKFSNYDENIFSKYEWLKSIESYNLEFMEIEFSEQITKLNEIEILCIWGYGTYDITIILSDEKEIIINGIELFNKNNEEISLVTLEI